MASLGNFPNRRKAVSVNLGGLLQPFDCVRWLNSEDRILNDFLQTWQVNDFAMVVNAEREEYSLTSFRTRSHDHSRNGSVKAVDTKAKSFTCDYIQKINYLEKWRRKYSNVYIILFKKIIQNLQRPNLLFLGEEKLAASYRPSNY